MSELFEAMKTFGVPAVMGVFLIWSLVRILWWVLKSGKEREDRLVGVIANHAEHQTDVMVEVKEALVRVSDSLGDVAEGLKDARTQHGTEHREMAAILNRMNGARGGQ